jgi:hypothetical protein
MIFSDSELDELRRRVNREPEKASASDIIACNPHLAQVQSSNEGRGRGRDAQQQQFSLSFVSEFIASHSCVG